ncbi:MAG: acetyl-coenzyme A synthetase N-terminal domain-containing protein, partial [Gammaproteobacteria bacterium]
MSAEKTYEIIPAAASRAHLDAAQYQAMYQRSIDDPEGFWAEQAEVFLDWS